LYDGWYTRRMLGILEKSQEHIFEKKEVENKITTSREIPQREM